MPIRMPNDTAGALGDGARHCQSRSLLQERLPFFDGAVDDWKRLSLNLWLTDGKTDTASLRQEQESTRKKQTDYREAKSRKFKPDRLAAANDYLSRTAALAGERETLTLRLPDTTWFCSLPSTRRADFKLFTASRLLIGLANGVVENAGLTLHRFFGIPQIPGSTQKGVARDAAVELGMSPDRIKVMFGNDLHDTAQQGAVCFLPAWPDDAEARLELDVITPHYGAYYGDKMSEAADGTKTLVNPDALDTEAPKPNPIPSVAAEVRFVFRLAVIHPRINEATAEDLLTTAAECLRHGLLHTGIGAKTRAGYGWFSQARNPKYETPSSDLFPELAMHIPPPLAPAQRVINAWKGESLGWGLFPRLCTDLMGLDIDDLKLAWEAVIPEQERRNFRLANPFWKDFIASRNSDGPRVLEKLGLKL